MSAPTTKLPNLFVVLPYTRAIQEQGLVDFVFHVQCQRYLSNVFHHDCQNASQPSEDV